MLKKFITYSFFSIFITSCATTPTLVAFSYEELELSGADLSTKLNVNVVEMQPGLLDTDSASREAGIWPELRRAESRQFSVKLAKAFNDSNAFSNVNVTTSSAYITDIVITGKIIVSNGEDVHLQITARDSTNKKLIDKKTYKHRTNEYYFNNIRNKGIDPFDPIYRSVVGDVITALKKQDLEKIELTTNLRFASQLNENQFYDALEKKNGYYELGFVPASNDPMLLRSKNVQLKDLAFRNEMQKHYVQFADEMEDSYGVWQKAAFSASKSKREAEAAAAAAAIVGALLVAAAASSAGDSYDDYSYGNIAAASVGAALMVSAVGSSREAKVHENTINEVSLSFDGEIAPKVVEMEGLQIKLDGNIKDQFGKWQVVLQDIYESESSQTNEFEVL